MLRNPLHRLASLFSSGRKRQQPAPPIDAFPVYEPEGRAAPEVPVSGEPDLAATRLIAEPQIRQPSPRPNLSSDRHRDATQRLPWPARDASTGQPHPPSSRGGIRASAPASTGAHDPTMLVGGAPDRPDRDGLPSEASAAANQDGGASPTYTSTDDRAAKSDATILVTARKRPPK